MPAVSPTSSPASSCGSRTVFGAILVVNFAYVVHDISALIMLFGIFFHVYLSTFGEPGTIQAMTRGTVSEAWAWTHHPAWYKAVTGRDPQRAMEEARKTERPILPPPTL